MPAVSDELPEPVPLTFETRAARLAWLSETFGATLTETDAADDDAPVARHPGGRQEGLRRLHAVRPGAYARSRNFLDGAVTRLSPYIRHGLITLAEARDYALSVACVDTAEKFVKELAWRDYWQRVLLAIGQGVRESREAWKTGFSEEDYAPELPQDIADGTTGKACIDGFVATLRREGWLHNHARMYLASYVVHTRRIHWRAGAEWMLGHLIDGDLASNHLSWQWVASTFGAKPYIFNRDNLERYTRGAYCERCPVADRCPFDATYGDLTRLYFPKLEQPAG